MRRWVGPGRGGAGCGGGLPGLAAAGRTSGGAGWVGQARLGAEGRSLGGAPSRPGRCLCAPAHPAAAVCSTVCVPQSEEEDDEEGDDDEDEDDDDEEEVRGCSCVGVSYMALANMHVHVAAGGAVRVPPPSFLLPSACPPACCVCVCVAACRRGVTARMRGMRSACRRQQQTPRSSRRSASSSERRQAPSPALPCALPELGC